MAITCDKVGEIPVKICLYRLTAVVLVVVFFASMVHQKIDLK